MFHAPKDVYGINLFRLFLDELGGKKPVATYLNVDYSTITRWLLEDRVPRAAVLALFWESNYGRSQIFTDQVNEIRQLYARVQLLEGQLERCTRIVAGLRTLHAGTANEPVFEAIPEIMPTPAPRFGESPRVHAQG